MSEAKFTKGPWQIVQYHETDSFGFVLPTTAIESAEYQTICLMDGAESGSDEFRAAANLIAAAPDMYAALEACTHALRENLARWQYKDEVVMLAAYSKADEALRKARGDTHL